MFRKLFVLFFFYFAYNKLIFAKKIEEMFPCGNETECEELLEKETLKESSSTTVESIYNTSSTTSSSSSIQVTNIQTIPTMQTPRKIIYNNETRNNTLHKIQSNVCECDLTTSSCDINCCCDKDCNDFHLTVFSHCKNHQPELYDKRYCYSRDFIERNNTPFILEKLANNLFCILYDNLPPTYSVVNDLDIKTEKDLREAIKPTKFQWRWENQVYVPEYSSFNSYKDGDIIWKIQNKYIQPLELPQSGFTELCAFKKTVNYLYEWRDQCLQTVLNNTNDFLFPAAFNNFTVIASPYLFNETNFEISEQVCPRNVCLMLTNYYCKHSWETCNNTMISGSCLNGTCLNIVTGVKYLIIHNGSLGINNIHVYFKIDNVSHSFYQKFEVIYKWADLDLGKTFSLSGNPGYTFGKPLIIGTLKINKTNNRDTKYISFNRTNSFFTLPLANQNGECDETKNYVVAFGENLKLRCSVSLFINNFNTSSCAELRNRTMHFLMKNSLFNITQTHQYNIYMSKSGNFTKNVTTDWVQILLDRIPEIIASGQIINGRLHCSGLITSVQWNILYSVLAKPETLTNYNILGVGVTFSERSDVFWTKCLTENCTDVLKVDVVNYVTFHDVSKPSKYYFVGGPYLDLTLPYDFFYPFLSNSKCVKSDIILIVSVVFTIILHNSIY